MSEILKLAVVLSIRKSLQPENFDSTIAPTKKRRLTWHTICNVYVHPCVSSPWNKKTHWRSRRFGWSFVGGMVRRLARFNVMANVWPSGWNGSGKALLPVRYAPFSAGSQVISPKSPTNFRVTKNSEDTEVASVGFRNSEGDTPRKELVEKTSTQKPPAIFWASKSSFSGGGTHNFTKQKKYRFLWAFHGFTAWIFVEDFVFISIRSIGRCL